MESNKDVETQSFHSGTFCMQSTTENSSEDVAKLKELLRQESRCHEETGQCYNTLQQEYDELLKRFAEAENTIDKLRIGTKIKLYYDKPMPSKSEFNFYEEPRCKSAQMIPLAQPQSAVISRAYSMPEPNFRNNLSTQTYDGLFEEGELVTRLQTLQDDITNFQMSLSDGHYTTEEQQRVFSLLRDEYDKIYGYLKVLEEDGQRERSETLNSRFTEDFAGSNSLQAEVYRLGLRLEEINEEIVEQLRNKQRNSSSDDDDDEKDSNAMRKRENERNGESSTISERSVRSSGHSRPASLQLEMREKQAGQPGYYTSQTLPPHQQQQQGPGSFEDKYLSRSLEVPSAADKSTACSVETENKVGSWLSREDHITTSPKRRSRSSTSPAISSKVHQSRKRTDVKLPNKFSHHSKLSTPEGGEGKTTYTMNSTEDSGFLDGGDPRNTKYGVPRHRSMTSPVETKYSHRYQPNFTRGKAVSVASSYGVQNKPDGEEYRDRLNSLRNFIDGRRQSTEERGMKCKTPRSWVRGIKTSSNVSQQMLHSPPSASSVASDKSDNPEIDNSCSSRKASNCSPIKRCSSPSLLRTYEPRSIHSNESETSALSINAVEQPRENEMLESLQEEMHGVRDLVLDLKSSLHLSAGNPAFSSTHASTSQQSPTKKKSALKPHSKEYKKIPSVEQRIQKDRKSFDQKPDIVQQQMHMLGRLNKTMERLSSKLQDMENRDQSANSSSSESEQTRRHKVSFQDDRNENFHSINPSTPTQTAMLKDLNNRVDNLYRNLQENPMSNQSKTSNRLPRDHSARFLPEQTRLVADMRDKLNKMETSVNALPRAEHSVHIPVYVQTCPVCNGCATHRHGSYLFQGGGDSRAVPEGKRRQRSPATSSRREYKDSWRSRKDGHESTTDEEQTDARLPSSDHLRLNAPNVIHHYHTFLSPSTTTDREQHKGGEQRFGDTRFSHSVQSNRSIPHKTMSLPHMSRDHHPVSTKEIELSNDPLYESINSATLAAKRMESLSKRMLSTIAADLFNAKDLNEY